MTQAYSNLKSTLALVRKNNQMLYSMLRWQSRINDRFRQQAEVLKFEDRSEMECERGKRVPVL